MSSSLYRSLTIPDFFAHKCVFLTGGTGFLGKVLLERLLYNCPKIDKVYMLTREKKGIGINERMKNILNDPLFQRLKNKRPQSLEKIVPVPGDINYARLGLSSKNEETLMNKVSVIIHAAATIQFNLPLKEAWRTNVDGTKMMLDLAQRLKTVEVFVYLSTAYTNPDRNVIDEVLYPPPADIDEVCYLMKDDLSDDDTSKIIGKHPNTYTFTKAICENLIAKSVADMPTVIVRPSMVCAIKNDPLKGWSDNWNGATRLLWSTAKSWNLGYYGRKSNILDVIPVDYVTNLVLAAAARNHRSRELKVYNSCSSDCNALSFEDLQNKFTQGVVKYKQVAGHSNAITHFMSLPKWYIITKHAWLLDLVTIMLQITPAYVADIYRRLTGKRPMYVELQSRLIKHRSMGFVSDKSYIMKTDQTRELFSSLSPLDQKMFPFDPTTIDWDEYLQNYAQGVPKFLENKIKF